MRAIATPQVPVAARISPQAVNEATADRFVQDLKARTLIRNVDDQRGTVVTAWNVALPTTTN